MKKLLIAVFLTASISVMNAQQSVKQNTEKPTAVQKGDVVTRTHKQTEHLFQILKLTADQKEKVYAINLDKNKQMDAARAKAAGNKALLSIDKKRIHEEWDKEITALLNAEQKLRWTKNKEEMKKKKAAAKTTNAVE